MAPVRTNDHCKGANAAVANRAEITDVPGPKRNRFSDLPAYFIILFLNLSRRVLHCGISVQTLNQMKVEELSCYLEDLDIVAVAENPLHSLPVCFTRKR